MKTSALGICLLVLVVGCSESEVGTVTDAGAATTSPAATLVSFNAGDTANLEVPKMSCSMACYPKVKETLEKIDGIASEELVPQEEEPAINDHRVTITFDGSVDGASAVAALSEAGFPESQFK